MNTYKSLRLITVDKNDEKSSVLIREYALYNIDMSQMMLSGGYKSVIIEEIPAYDLYTWDGFYIEHVPQDVKQMRLEQKFKLFGY